MAVNLVLPEQTEAPFQFTDKAIQQIKNYQKLLQIQPPTALRISTRKQGANYEPIIGFDERGVSDYLYRVAGIEIVVNRNEVAHVKNFLIDYKETPTAKGFLFKEAPSARP